LNTYNHGDG